MFCLACDGVGDRWRGGVSWRPGWRRERAAALLALPWKRSPLGDPFRCLDPHLPATASTDEPCTRLPPPPRAAPIACFVWHATGLATGAVPCGGQVGAVSAQQPCLLCRVTETGAKCGSAFRGGAGARRGRLPVRGSPAKPSRQRRPDKARAGDGHAGTATAAAGGPPVGFGGASFCRAAAHKRARALKRGICPVLGSPTRRKTGASPPAPPPGHARALTRAAP